MKKLGIVIISCLVLALSVVGGLAMGGAQADDVSGLSRGRLIQDLSRNAKLGAPESVLRDFINGESTTRVIVTLHKPMTARGLTTIKDLNIREQLAEEVRSARENVSNRLDVDEVTITNEYEYPFGARLTRSRSG